MKAERLCIKDWFQLEEIRDSYKRKEIGFVSFITQVVSLGTNDKINYRKEYWGNVVETFQEILKLNQPKDIPLFRIQPKKNKKKDDEIPWDYVGRNWYDFLHTLASNLNWDIDTVSSLDIDDGMALLQEIRVNEQLQREWEWGMSPNSIGYNKSTKESEFIPYKYPYFMLPELKPLPKINMAAKYTPVGNVVRLGE